MSDQVTGIAVLDRTRIFYQESERLLIQCVYKSGLPTLDSIPVHPKGTEPIKHPSWQYEIQGDTLAVTPSVRICTTRPSKTNPAENETVELFHNDGAWSVKFREFVPGDHAASAYQMFRALNEPPR